MIKSGNLLAKKQLFFPTGDMYKGHHGATQGFALSVLSDLAMDRKCPEAQTYLGLCYQFGYGVGVDEKRAAELYSMAASQGFFEGQRNLGHMYLRGRGVPKDTAMAEWWLFKAAKKGDGGAEEMLRMMRGEVNGGGGV